LAARKETSTHHHARSAPSSDSEEQNDPAKAAGHADHVEPQGMSKIAEQEKSVLLKSAAGHEAVPFAYAALQPAKEEFKAEAPEDHPSRDDDGENESDGEPEDADARRERLARKATDDLLRPEPEVEPELKITRDSSEADRAYALYQRMAGF